MCERERERERACAQNLQNLRLLQQCHRRFKCSGMCCCVSGRVVADVLSDCSAYLRYQVVQGEVNRFTMRMKAITVLQDAGKSAPMTYHHITQDLTVLANIV